SFFPLPYLSSLSPLPLPLSLTELSLSLSLSTLHRLKLMSSPSLSDLGKSDKAALEERGTQQRKAGIHNAVIAVFQRKDLGENDLYILNEGVRNYNIEHSHFFESMLISQKLLDSLAETWDFFFCDVLSMLQAIFYPVQGKEPSVRQLALLHFRSIITLNIKLEDALSRPRARVPPLYHTDGVHESKGVTEEYLRLEALVQKVVSPYLGTHGLYSNDGSSMQYSSCVLEKRLQRCWPKSGDAPVKNLVMRSKSYNVPMLTPVVEYDTETGSVSSMGIRRHSVCEMTSCLEEGAINDISTTSSLSLGSLLQPSIFQGSHSPGPFLHGGGESTVSPSVLCQVHSGSETGSIPSCSSSPETVVDQILDSMDSDPDGIFIDFSLHSIVERKQWKGEEINQT
uniref:Proline rich 5 n=1 Tax=Oncorhynchus kisutch TaxID=8019 RepID=A0A8C7KPF6_ONCKI